MKSVLSIALLLAVCSASAHATDLNVRVLSNGQPSAGAAPGQAVTYTINGELSDNASAGLALFALDLSFSGGPLAQAGTPTLFPMKNFASPLGMTNPAGYGGTVALSGLLQIGGAQNTIRNTIAPSPTGNVIIDVAQLGSPVVLDSGTLTAPYQVGTYTLVPSNVIANVLLPGQGTNPPFWKVEPAGAGVASPLTLTVVAMRPTRTTVSPSQGQTVNYSISAGPANAGRTYKAVGCWSGTAPGTLLPGGKTLPLNKDRYLEYSTALPNSPILQNSQGTLDAAGRAVFTFAPTAAFEGLTVHHAFYLLGPIDFVSEAEPVLVVH